MGNSLQPGCASAEGVQYPEVLTQWKYFVPATRKQSRQPPGGAAKLLTGSDARVEYGMTELTGPLSEDLECQTF